MKDELEEIIEIRDPEVDVEEIMRRIRERIAQRDLASQPGDVESPTDIAEAARQEIIEDAETFGLGHRFSIRRRECDIVPRHYVIDWRIPILGPIHSVVRRIINDEIRRYLMPSLKKQSTLNRRMLRALKELSRENTELRQELEALRSQG